MPAYNEAEGIAEFLRELNASLEPWNPAFVVVDDASRDGTAAAALAAAPWQRCGSAWRVIPMQWSPSTVMASSLVRMSLGWCSPLWTKTSRSWRGYEWNVGMPSTDGRPPR